MKRNGEFYIVRFQNGKFIQLRDNRLYKLLEEQKQNFLVKRGYEKRKYNQRMDMIIKNMAKGG